MDRRFAQQKDFALKRLEEAKQRGEVDLDVISLLDYVNSLEGYYTTSSCSGRISLFWDLGGKLESDWLGKWHRQVSYAEVLECFRERADSGIIWLRFEPSIFHIASRDLDSAVALMTLARNHGFKKVGLIGLKESRYIVELCSSERIDAPLSDGGAPLVDDSYIEYLTGLANKQFADGLKRMACFMSGLKKDLA